MIGRAARTMTASDTTEWFPRAFDTDICKTVDQFQPESHHVRHSRNRDWTHRRVVARRGHVVPPGPEERLTSTALPHRADEKGA